MVKLPLKPLKMTRKLEEAMCYGYGSLCRGGGGANKGKTRHPPPLSSFFMVKIKAEKKKHHKAPIVKGGSVGREGITVFA